MQYGTSVARAISVGRFFTASMAAVLGATAAFATSSEEAMRLCGEEMLNNQAAVEVRDFKVRRHDDIPYAYGTVDFPDMKDLRFRCKVYNDEVIEVQYLVPDPEFVDGTAWSQTRPQAENRDLIELDEAVTSSPPPVPTSPKFERAPD